MRFRRLSYRLSRAFVTLVLAAAAIVQLAPPALAAPVLVWERVLPSPASIVMSSPAPVTLADGSPGIVVGARDRKVYVVRASDGSDAPGWPQFTSDIIDSSPAVADTDNSGKPEIFIGSGNAALLSGGLYSFDINGNPRFHIVPSDGAGPNLPVQATPVIGDIHRAGVADVTVGDLGQTVLSVSQNGSTNPGWPYLAYDSVFSSAALADVNGDGTTDVVEGGDSYPGTPGHPKGGLVRAIDGGGQTLWESRTDEQVYSSPSIGDIDGDGRPEVVFGGGTYWFNHGGATDSTKLHVINIDGSPKAGWPKQTDNFTTASPTLADITGSGRLAVITGTWNPNPTSSPGSVYAWDGQTGAEIWPHHPAQAGTVINGQIVTADFNGDGAQDLLVPTSSGVFALDGKSGQNLFSVEAGRVSLQNSPLITDFSGKGTVSIIVAGQGANKTGVIARYDLPASDHAALGNLGWPMFRKDPRRTGSWTNPPLTQSFCARPGGYWLGASDGGIFNYCNARFFGSMGNIHLNQPIVGMAPTPSGGGYWLVASDGGIFNFGDAGFFGSTGNIRLNQPIVAMAPTPSGRGYWLVARDGGIFNFGDAGFFGSTGNIRLNQPIVGAAATASGAGYWLVARDGGIFTFGDAGFFGSTGNILLNQPIVGMGHTASGGGYWMVASDGGIFNFGDAGFFGSTGNIHLNQPIVGMAPTNSGAGYWLVARDGGIFNYGDAGFFGSTGGIHLNQPIIGMASAP
jgi:hypothetical protein